MKDEKKDYNHNKENKTSGDRIDLGEKILDIIQDSIDSMDFSGLSASIKDAVDYAKEEADWQIRNARMRQQEWQKEKIKGNKYRYRREPGNRWQRQRERYDAPSETHVSGKAAKKLPGTYSGPIQTGLGGTGVAVFGSLSLGFAIAGVGMAAVGGLFSTTAVVLESVFVPLTILSAVFLGRGVLGSRRVRRMKKYIKLWEGRSFMMLKDLAGQSGFSIKQIRKDVQYIMERQLIPDLCLDEEQTCLLLTEEAMEQYAAAKQTQKEKEREAARQKEMSRQKEETEKEEQVSCRMRQLSEQYLEEIRERKNRIHTTSISEKISRLEFLLTRIFVCVKEHPETQPQIERLVEYYIPSVLKLLRVYEDLEKQPVEGENIQKTKKEIEDSLDMINQALENMFDELFQDIAMDISSDIRVLEMMLAKDGWKEQEMHSSKQEKDTLFI